MKRTTFKKQKQDLLGEITLLEEDLLWDEDIQELRFKQWNTRIEQQQRQHMEEKTCRYRQYFFQDGSCKVHNRDGCCECSHYASGQCPSYWEEMY